MQDCSESIRIDDGNGWLGENVKRKIVVWGTGKEAGMMLDKLESLGSWNDDLVAFCDNNKDKK